MCVCVCLYMLIHFIHQIFFQNIKMREKKCFFLRFLSFSFSQYILNVWHLWIFFLFLLYQYNIRMMMLLFLFGGWQTIFPWYLNHLNTHIKKNKRNHHVYLVNWISIRWRWELRIQVFLFFLSIHFSYSSKKKTTCRPPFSSTINKNRRVEQS